MSLSSLLLELKLFKVVQQELLLHPFSFALTLIFSLLILIKLLHGASLKKVNLPPSPPKFPIIGNLHQLGTLVHRSLRDLSQKHGPLMLLQLGQVPALIVSSPEIAAEITKNQDLVFANRPATTAAKALLYGCTDVGFAPYGEYWRQVRKICVFELLSLKRVESFKFVRVEEVALVIQKITSSSMAKEKVNLSEILLTLSNTIVLRCAFGAKYEGAHENRFGELSREVMVLLGAFSFKDYFPSLGWIDVLTGLTTKLRKTFQELDTFFDKVIDEHLHHKSSEEVQINDQEEVDKKDLIDILLDVQKTNSNLTRDNIKAIILDMFVGGSDTTSTVLEWSMAELIKNPKMMKKAQEEIRRVVGKKPKVEEEDINKMDYFKCIVKESLRLHAPVPSLLPRVSSKSTKIKGYDIPLNARVYINAWAIQRDPEVWEYAEEFRPERFVENPIDIKGQDFQLIPFGSGRRGCPAISFGLAVVELALANLLYSFNWELPDDENYEDLDMAEAFGITVNKKNPLYVIPTTFDHA